MADRRAWTEARAGRRLIKADLCWLEHCGELIFNDESTRLRYVEVIRRVQPDLIITHSPGYHPDYRMVNRLVFDASSLSGLPNIKTDSPAHLAMQPLYYFGSASGVGFEPTESVDTTDTFEVKRAMLSKHASQAEWLQYGDGIDVPGNIKVSARARGFQCGVSIAEGFRPEFAMARLRPCRVLP